MLLSLKPDTNAKRLKVLKEVNEVDFSDVSEYVIAHAKHTEEAKRQ